jgi:UDP-N-acetylglucosamine--N-acetylmuramyl-(pentapeptide) pyrophosphoryl-undecaprenol N-acetylglucosamine transferase
MKKQIQQYKEKVIVLSGGGTGGHIYPAVAIGNEILKYPDTKVYYVGNPQNLEKTITANEKFSFLPINISGIPKNKKQFPSFLLKLFGAVYTCIKYFLKIKPDYIFGTGGYVSGPALIAGKILNIPIMLHDSDAYPGIVTRKMSKFANAINLSFEQAKKYLANNKNISVYGNPLRNDFENIDKTEGKKELGLDLKRFTIVIMGGSQGAKSINSAIKDIALDLIENYPIQIIHQTGKKNYEEYMDSISSELRNNKYYLVKPYFDKMAIPLLSADLVVARAGSLSISEFNLCELPSILIPYPYAANNHQFYNAKAQEENGASVCLEDKLCDGDNLREIILALYNDKYSLNKMSFAAKNLAKPQARELISVKLLSL